MSVAIQIDRAQMYSSATNRKESRMNVAGKTLVVKAVSRSLGLLLAAGAFLAGCASLPKDDAPLAEIKFDKLMGCRYTEILLVFGDAFTKNFMAGVYNSTYLNAPPGTCDYSPAAILDKIDMKKVKEDNDALSDVKNGPRFWTVDHIGVKAGKERDFQGLKARWVMWFPIPDEIREGKDPSYAIMTAKRDTSMSIDKGSRVSILDDPQGYLVRHEIGQPDQGLGPEARRS